MNTQIEKIAFILVIIGTLGLLANEFLFAWGRGATLTFAGVNLIGLIALAITRWRKGGSRAP